MNKKITFPELVETVATATGASKRTSEMFLKELFAVISNSLANGENVRIKNLGQFKLTEVGERKSVNVNTGEEMRIPSHTKVSFVPDKAIADAINLPFASFEAVEISNNITEDELKQMASVYESKGDDLEAVEEEKPVDEEQNPENVEDVIAEEKDDKDNVLNEESDSTANESINEVVEEAVSGEEPVGEFTTPDESRKDETVNGSEELDDDANNANEEIEEAQGGAYGNDKNLDELRRHLEASYTSPYKSSLFFRGYFWGALSMLVIAAVVFYSYYLYVEEDRAYANAVAFVAAPAVQGENSTAVPQKENVANDSAVETKEASQGMVERDAVVDKAATAVRYDTISRSRYLTTMSREYYGDFRFWVYIYEENKDKIDNPNAIAPGTVVVIPPASKYGIDKDDQSSVERAKAKVLEVMENYK